MKIAVYCRATYTKICCVRQECKIGISATKNMKHTILIYRNNILWRIHFLSAFSPRRISMERVKEETYYSYNEFPKSVSKADLWIAFVLSLWHTFKFYQPWIIFHIFILIEKKCHLTFNNITNSFTLKILVKIQIYFIVKTKNLIIIYKKSRVKTKFSHPYWQI